MKNVHIVALLGGAAALYFVTKKKSDAPRHTTAPQTAPPRAPSRGAFTLKIDPSGGKGCVDGSGRPVPLSFCTDPASQLEGYFPTGYFSTGDACCSNCASGLRCAG